MKIKHGEFANKKCLKQHECSQSVQLIPGKAVS